MCLWVRVYSSSSSTGLFPNDFTTKAWSPLLDGDPPAQGVYHIPALQPSVAASTHTYTYIYRSIDSCSPLRRAARKLGGPVIAFYYSSNMKHCCSPCDHPPTHPRFRSACLHKLSWCWGCMELLGHRVTRPGPRGYSVSQT